MTWKQIKPRSLAARVRDDAPQRTLVTWSTDAGDMFAHGMLASGPERDDSPEAEPSDRHMYLRMKYETRRDRLARWKYLPRITYGFRPAGTEKFLIGRDLGTSPGGESWFFEVPTGRKNKPKFFVPSRDEEGKLYELPGPAQMYEAMVEGGWESRHMWAYNIRQGLNYYRMQGRMPHDMPVTELVDTETLDKVRSLMSERLPVMTEMRVKKSDNLMHRKSWLQQYGLIAHIEKLSVYDFQELVGDFCMSMYTVAGRNRHQGDEPLFPEEYDYLQLVLREMNDRRRERERDVMEATVAERTGDTAWSKVMEERWHMARGNLIEDFQRAMKIEPEEVIRNSVDAGVQVLT